MMEIILLEMDEMLHVLLRLDGAVLLEILLLRVFALILEETVKL